MTTNGPASRSHPRVPVQLTALRKGVGMSTISFIQSTTLRPDQYIAGLTYFGPGRSKIFSNSADSYLKVHHVGPTEADVTEGSGGPGSACTTTGRSPTASCSRPPTPTPGAAGPWFCPCSASTSRFGSTTATRSTGSERASRVRYGCRGGIPCARTVRDDQMTCGSVLPTNQRPIRLHGGGAGRHGTADVSAANQTRKELP